MRERFGGATWPSLQWVIRLPKMTQNPGSATVPGLIEATAIGHRLGRPDQGHLTGRVRKAENQDL